MTSIRDRLKLFEEKLKQLEDASSDSENEEDDDDVNPALGAKYHNDTLALRHIKKLAVVELRVVKTDLNNPTTSKEAYACSSDSNEAKILCTPSTSRIGIKNTEQSKSVENKVEEITICSKPSEYTKCTSEKIFNLKSVHMPSSNTPPIVEDEPFLTKSYSNAMMNNRSKNMLTSLSSSKSEDEVNIRQQLKLVSTDSARGSSLQSVESREAPSTSNVADYQNIACQTADPCSPFVVDVNRKPKKVLRVSNNEYLVLNVLGRGGSCVVYQAYNEESKICYAIKCVDLSDADDILIKAYKNEIWLLKALQSSNRVVKMFDYDYVSEEQMLYVVMEKGDTDLATFFKKRGQNRLDYLTLAFYWSEMLKAVQVVHQKGIVHSDLKPRNFLIVGGQVKLIDFGIANAVPSNKTSVTKECQMGTPNYMSPEALSSFEDVDRCKFRVGVKSDVWSLGCILYYMVYGKTPFEHVPNNCKMFAITNCKYQIEFEPIEDLNLLNVMQRCLERDPRKRASVEELLNHTYLKKYSHGSMVNARSLSDEKIKDLALLASKNTPKTNAKLLK